MRSINSLICQEAQPWTYVVHGIRERHNSSVLGEFTSGGTVSTAV
jgi:hypothetical protein